MNFAAVSIHLAGAMLGAMVFFAGVVAPVVFKALPEASARTFLRTLFPRYYDVLAVVAFVAAVFAFASWHGAMLAGVGGLFVFSRFGLMPKINAARDASASDEAAATRFERLHKLSVWINVAQMAALIAALATAG
ncbi:MAG: DUF4149 domain-containing protein [Myxococcota bacterium]